MNDDLLDSLRTAQRVGFFGNRPIEEAMEHSAGFVDALESGGRFDTLIDLGSGGGLPGLVLATAFPNTRVTLLDRRQKRTDFLQRAVLHLALPLVTVRFDDVRRLIHEVRVGVLEPFDVVTARGFGPPEATLRAACGLLAPNGRIIISEPPAGDRWNPTVLAELGVVGVRRGGVSVFTPH